MAAANWKVGVNKELIDVEFCFVFLHKTETGRALTDWDRLTCFVFWAQMRHMKRVNYLGPAGNSGGLV